MTGPATLECPHGINAKFGCAECARIERRQLAIPLVAQIAVTLARIPGARQVPDVLAKEAWTLYEAVCRQV